jgi:hypothetical protein
MNGGLEEGGDFRRWTYWIRKKKVEVFTRTYLSVALAVVLVVLVALREWKDLSRAGDLFSVLEWLCLVAIMSAGPLLLRYYWVCVIRRWRNAGIAEHLISWLVVISSVVAGVTHGHGLVQKFQSIAPSDKIELFVLMIVIGTLGAALWELFGEKLHSSRRDRQFIYSVRLLLRMKDELSATPRLTSVTLEKFIETLLDSACETLCGKTKVAAGYMIIERGFLKLIKTSSNAKYDMTLSIPVDKLEEPGPGPAAVAYKQAERMLVYMPDKETREAWRVHPLGDQERFTLPAPIDAGWVPTSDPTLESFRSVLCVPVRFSAGDKEKNTGILTFSSQNRDPFLSRDFVFAECFANILAQAIATDSLQQLGK